MNALGKKLRDLRKSSGYTVREFAARVHKSPGYISRIEARGEIPSAELLCELAQILGVDPSELLELAKRCQLEDTRRTIETKQEAALTLFRKTRQ
jgi:transcriptional regulator with XRE-family HTH domain